MRRSGTPSVLAFRTHGRLCFVVACATIVIIAPRFLIVVLSAYKQIRAQSEDVLSGVGEDNFDKAFNFLRPGIYHAQRHISPTHRTFFVLVIQGNADLGPRLSESEVQNALDFCASLFNPFNRGVANDLRRHLEGLDDDQFSAHGVEKSALMDVTAPLLPTKEVQNIARDPSFLPALENCSAEEAEAEVQRILERINARRLIHREHSGLHSLEEESLGAGYRIRLECGRLGLMQGKAVNYA
jgi:hypothetical protein